MLELINRRAELAIEVRGLKKKDSLGVYDPGREREIEAKITGSNPGPLSSEDILFVFREIISRCRSLQHDEKVAYLGPEAVFQTRPHFENSAYPPSFFPYRASRECSRRCTAKGLISA